MKHYEVTFIVDPVLLGDEVKATAQKYVDYLTAEGGTIVHFDDMGLRPMAYPIQRKQSGVYYCVEFSMPNGETIDKLELMMRRDERLLRFLTVSLDKFGVQYNADRRAGKIGKAKPPKKAVEPTPYVRPAQAQREAVVDVEIPEAIAAIDPELDAII